MTHLKSVDGDAIVVSQFTLHASTKKGNRPSYTKAAKPEVAEPLYLKFIEKFEQELGKEGGCRCIWWRYEGFSIK